MPHTYTAARKVLVNKYYDEFYKIYTDFKKDKPTDIELTGRELNLWISKTRKKAVAVLISRHFEEYKNHSRAFLEMGYWS